ncbi:protein flightless-1 homolog [Dysidea avara]|uniref:protein flightless-1 homolog n=1 Tax=Dysidea avara TaxID=196820 RepID=UPI003330F43F
MASVLSFVRGADFSKNDFHQASQVSRVTQISNIKWMRVNNSSITKLPDELENLQRLEVLYLARNKLNELHTGNIPSLSSLRVLYASHNELRDSGIPSDLFKLEHLATLDFSHNDLSKIPDELLHAKGVLVLALSHNRISNIPGAVFVHCSDIQSLNLSNNQLQSLPPQIRRLSHLQVLNLANNPLNHYQFKMLEKLTSLTTLDLSNTGVLSSYTPNLERLQSLSDVNFAHNELTRVPDSLYLLESLQRVNVSHNSIKELSTLIESWSLLVTLNVSNNQLTSIPTQICKCTKLKRLFLSDNNLTFEGIPPQIGKLQDLEHFVAARNQLKCIPEGICRCYRLKKLILTTNNLLTLPEGLYFLNLEVLDTRDNPELGMPPKPTEQLTGSGTELYNIDFDPIKLKEGAVVSQSTLLPTSFSRRKERVIKMARLRGNSMTRRDESSAKKVLKGLAQVADDKHQQRMEGISEDEQIGVVLGKPKPWTAMLNRPNLDYTSLFPEKPGHLPGLSVWQIENFLPVIVDDVLHGKFYIGDCYIVLKTFFDESSNLDWRIHYWIGQDTSLDKMACAAMHAVHLRNMLGADSRTMREEQSSESEEFEELFDHDLTYVEGGTASGFYSSEDEEITPRMYLLSRMKQTNLEPVMLHVGSLDQGQVFILVTNKSIFVWCGTKSSLTQRSKGRLVAEKINKNDHKNMATVQLFKYGNEPEKFWDFLGGPPEQQIWHDQGSKSYSSHLNQQPKVYQVTLGKGYLELPQVQIPGGLLIKDLLNTRHVYIIDCYSELFVWVGKRSERLVRAAALRLAQELCDLLERPAVATVTKVLQGAEQFVFRCKFVGWEGVLREDYSVVKGEKKSTERKAPKVDLSPLFLPRQTPMSNREADNKMDEFNANLKSDMQCFVLEGRKFVRLPKREIGHFYSEDCYVFLCQYETTPDDKIEEEDDDDDDDDENETHTVVYFWQGRDASNMGWLTFTFSFQQQIKKLIAGPVFVKRVQQQQEEYRLLSHFGGKLIMHQGKRGGTVDSSKPELYQIRSNSNKICRRVVQVPATPTSLCSAFCYVLKVPFEGSGSGIVYIWIGSQATQEEAINAEQMGRSMFEMSFSNQTIKEGAEPENFFWVALGKREEYDKEATFLRYTRLFRCSNSKGFFSVEEECQDFCQDSLSEDDVMLLDTGNEVFIWVGSVASDVVKKLSLKSAQVYIKHLADHPNQPPRKIRVAKHGSEPREFKRCFHGWSSSSS